MHNCLENKLNQANAVKGVWASLLEDGTQPECATDFKLAVFQNTLLTFRWTGRPSTSRPPDHQYETYWPTGGSGGCRPHLNPPTT